MSHANDPFGRTVIHAVKDLFGPFFQPRESWAVWLEVVLPALYGLPLDAAKLRVFQRATGRTQLFQGMVSEAWFLCGRRSGKSRFLALMAVLIALFRDYGRWTAPGEQPMVMILAADRDQAGAIFGYARALIQEIPLLSDMLERETVDELMFKSGVVIAVHTSSYKSVRGRTLAAALCDEAAFWQSDDSRNPAEAILRALRPALSTIPGAPLLVASSTYTADGILFEAFQRHHGKDTSPVMVWKADTQSMNPTFRKEVIDAAYAADAQDAAAEYGAQWLTDVRQFLPDDLINEATVIERRSLPRAAGAGFHYVAFCDPSGGVHDAMTLAIAHRDAQRLVVLDRIEAVQPKFEPEEVVQRFADILGSYGINTVTGDRYAGEWVSSMFRRFGITYVPSEFDKSQIYTNVQPLFAQHVVELIDNPKMAGELRRLERRARSGGRDQVDHPRGAHDDMANAACGALLLASRVTWSGRVALDHMPLRSYRRDYDPHLRFAREQAEEAGERFNE